MRLVLVLALVACSKSEPAPVASPPVAPSPAAVTAAPKLVAPPRPAELQHVWIKALGMDCEESCPMRVRYAIGANKAIYELGFDTSRESIFVSYDKSLGDPKTVTAPLLDAIRQAGFDPWLSKDAWPDDAQPLVAVVLR